MDSCPDKFCSLASIAANEDPIGTANSADLLLVLELPLPWEREFWRSPEFPAGLFDSVAGNMARLGLRLLCIAPDPAHSRPGHRRLMVLRRPPHPSAHYHRDEYLLPTDAVLPLAQALVDGSSPEPFAGWRQPVDGVRDLMVCTHGSVDAACAKFGFPAYDELRRSLSAAAPGLRVWRVSHFGGHRFAPTILELPSLRFWAHLDSEALGMLVRQDRPPVDLHRHYRGWGMLRSPWEQVVERAALEQEGWDWLTYAVEGHLALAEGDPEQARVTLHFRSPDGSVTGRYEAAVTISHRVQTVMATGKEPEPAPQYAITALTRIPTA